MLVAVLAFGGVAGLTWLRIARNLDAPAAWGQQDFRDVVYYPVVAFIEGHNPYDAAEQFDEYPVTQRFPPYLPLTLLVHLPLGFLSVGTAGALYFVAMLGMILGVAYLSLVGARLRPGLVGVLGLGTLLVLCRPGQWALFTGQCSPIAVVAAYVAVLAARTRPRLAALGLAVASFKPTFGVPLALVLLTTGHVRVALTGLAVAAVGSLIPTVVLAHSAGGAGPFLVSALRSQDAFGPSMTVDPESNWSRVDAVALLARWSGGSSGMAGELLVPVLTLGLGVFALRCLARAGDTDGPLPASVLFLTLLTCTYHQAYDLLLLALPLVALVIARPGPTRPLAPAARWLLAALMAFPLVNYLAAARVMDGLGLVGESGVLVASLNGVALLAALLASVALALYAVATSKRWTPRSVGAR